MAGSVACAVGGAAFALPLLQYFVRAGAFALAPAQGVALRVVACAVVAALVESLPLPVEGADNVTVPLAAALASTVLFGA